MSTLERAVAQRRLTPDTVDAQFCSDWLKGEIKRLFGELDVAQALRCPETCHPPTTGGCEFTALLAAARRVDGLGLHRGELTEALRPFRAPGDGGGDGAP